MQTRLEDVLEDEKCYAEDVFKTSWRRLGKQEMFAGIVYQLLSLIKPCSDERQNGFKSLKLKRC